MQLSVERRIETYGECSSSAAGSAENCNNAIDVSQSLLTIGEATFQALGQIGKTVVIACDEVTELCDTRDHRELSKPRPNERAQQLSEFVCRAISSFSRSIDCPIWTVFLSTSLVDFTGSREICMCRSSICEITGLKG